MSKYAHHHKLIDDAEQILTRRDVQSGDFTSIIRRLVSELKIRPIVMSIDQSFEMVEKPLGKTDLKILKPMVGRIATLSVTTPCGIEYVLQGELKSVAWSE